MKLAANAAGTDDQPSSKEIKTMKALIKIALAAVMFATTLATQAA